MKTLLKLLLLIAAVWTVWTMVKQKHRADFKNNLPPVMVAATGAWDTLPPAYFRGFPRISEQARPEAQRQTLEWLSRLLFDTLRLDTLHHAQILRCSLSTLHAPTLLQLMRKQQQQPEQQARLNALISVGLLLSDEAAAREMVQNYLMPEKLWLPAMRRHHFLLMRQPGDAALQHAWATLLAPADTKQTLAYLLEVQFLERDPWEEYFRVNYRVLARFDKSLLGLLLDKVDDYAWYAAYPERDAEQGILKLLEGK